MKRLVQFVALATMVLVCAMRADAAPMLTLLPASGGVTAAPGETVGWGYEIVNDDPTQWLVISSLATDGFQYGSGSDLIFDFPIIAPGSSWTQAYVSGVQGLFEFTWDSSVPLAFVNNGSFILTGEFWDGDPFQGGQFVSSTPDLSAAYSVAVTTTSPVPEPSTLLLLAAGIVVITRVRPPQVSGDES